MLQSCELSLESSCPIKAYFPSPPASRDNAMWTEMMRVTSRPWLLSSYCTFTTCPIPLAGCRQANPYGLTEPQDGRSLGQNPLIKETSTNREPLHWTTTLARNELLLCLRYYTLWDRSTHELNTRRAPKSPPLQRPNSSPHTWRELWSWISLINMW